MNKIRKNDEVKIVLGKDRGKTGKIERVLPKTGKALVAGLNTVKRHVRGRAGVEGGIIEITKPVDISNVVLVCPSCKKVTRAGFEVKGDLKIRICRKCKKEIK